MRLTPRVTLLVGMMAAALGHIAHGQRNPVNEYDAYSFNNVTAGKNEDGSITIHFGGDSSQPNFLPIVPGWNYIVRLYQPRKEILDGTWTFPDPREVP